MDDEGDQDTGDGWGHDPEQERRDKADAAALRRHQLLRERVDAVDQDLAEMRRAHVELASTVSERLGPELEALGESVTAELEQLRGTVAEVLAEQTKAENPPVDWAQLSVEEARDQWPALARWIGEVFVPVYGVTRNELPDCWPLHFTAVVELSWLRSAHVQSYLPGTHPNITADWHTRWRPMVLARLTEIIAGGGVEERCEPGKHLGRLLPADPAEETPAGSTPRKMLALPQHWWPAYRIGFQEDLARRARRQETSVADWIPDPLP